MGDTEADAAPAAPPLPSALSGFVPRNPNPDRSAMEDTCSAIEAAGDVMRALRPVARGQQRRRTLAPPAPTIAALQPEQRLLLLDTWQHRCLPAAEFATLVGLSKFTLYAWQKKFEREGWAGLMDKPKGTPAGSRLAELTKRTILMLKQANPDWGCQKISDMLQRGPALPASASAVANRSHPPRASRFERATPNQLCQTDLFTFMLKRQITGSTWLLFWTITAASWSATGCTPAGRRRW